jgi:hypothetical protein
MYILLLNTTTTTSFRRKTDLTSLLYDRDPIGFSYRGQGGECYIDDVACLMRKDCHRPI